MKKTFICITCPNGCEIGVEYEGDHIGSIEGHLCPKGVEYVNKELFFPERNIASLVYVENGRIPLASVKTSKPIPKDLIFDVVCEIKKQKLKAPARIGDIVIEDVLGTGSDIVVTKDVERLEP